MISKNYLFLRFNVFSKSDLTLVLLFWVVAHVFSNTELGNLHSVPKVLLLVNIPIGTLSKTLDVADFSAFSPRHVDCCSKCCQLSSTVTVIVSLSR